MDLKTVYFVEGEKVEPYYEIGGYYVHTASLIVPKSKKDNPYPTLKEARYQSFLKCLEKGKPYTNYRSSKYYSYYMERLKVEQPEYLV